MIRIFISHSGKDVPLIEQVTNLLLSALEISEKEIRCTSVPGFQLEGGAHTSTQLKQDLQGCEAILGVLTENSLDSMYVMFEFGAGWGLNKRLIPILGPEFSHSDLRPPLSESHAIKWNSAAGWFQLIEGLSQTLDVKMRSLALFSANIEKLVAFGKPKEIKVSYPALGDPTVSGGPGGGPRQLIPRNCSEESSLRSLSFDTKTIVTFTNETSKEVKLYWIDYDGDRIFYGTLKPGESKRQKTCLTHPFILTDQNDNCLAIYLPTLEPSVAILEE
jgi:hypothetical protein